VNHDDAHLLGKLGSALATVPARPDGREVAALHRSVAARRQQSAQLEGVAVARRTPRLHHPRVVAISVVAGTLTLGTGVAAAAGAPVLREIREVAHDIGLPVESPAVTDTNQAMTNLRDALARSNASEVREARDRLRSDLQGLSGSDRAAAQPDADALLRLADARLAPTPVPSGTALAPDPSAPTKTGAAGTPPKGSSGIPPAPGEHSTDHTGDRGSSTGGPGSATPGDNSDQHDGHGGGRDATTTATTTASSHGESGGDEIPERSGSHGHDSATTATTPTPTSGR
jgi:hypothetical protein